MADVLLGRTDGIEGFERHVVLKRIRPEYARDQRFIRMLLDEARVAANLHHQHIVQVHDIGESAGEYFIAMEYIHGEDVRTILSTASKTRAHVPLGHAIAIVSAVAAGLHYAHEKRGSDKRPLGIVHRDVSPSNILVGYDGSIKVVDFGIAKAAMSQETRSGALKGKVSYMSPEQCRSEAIDRRSDVYSLGVVLYELATTTRLFKGDNDYLVMDQIVNGRVSLPRVRRPDLPNELSAIIMRALASDAERRYFTADELRVALDQFASKAGLTTSTSAIAAYMRKQFGERPEPWLEINGIPDDILIPVGGVVPTSWIEMPHGEDGLRNSGPIARPSGPVSLVSERASDPAMSQANSVRVSAPRLVSMPPPADSKMGWESQKPAPTDSKMGWESQKPAAMPRGFTPARIAMVCTPLALLLGFAIWRLSGTGDTISPTAAIATRTSAPATPVVTPIPELAQPPAAVADGSIAAPVTAPAPAMGKAAERAPAPTPVPASTKRGGPTAPAVAKKAATAKAMDAAAPMPSPGTKAEAATTSSQTTPAQAPLVSVAAAATSGSGTSPSAAPPPPAAPPPSAALPPVAATPAGAAATPAPTAMPAATPPPPAAAAPPVPAVEAAPLQLAQAMVEHVASEHARELAKCDGGEELHGEITVKFSVDTGGKVTKAQVATGIKKPLIIACILRSVQGWHFPKQGPTGAQGTYTLSFQ